MMVFRVVRIRVRVADHRLDQKRRLTKREIVQ